jgi:hypothetical protein
MAFTWIDVTAGVIAKATHVNQVQTNTNTLADNLGIPHPSWTELPVSPGDKMKASQIAELQSSLDYIDTNNVCSAENTGEFSSDQSSFDSSVDSGKDVTYNNNIETNYDGTNRGAFQNDQHVTYYNNVDTSDWGLYYSGRLSYQNTGANSVN